ncbi:MAG TPA: hypothetical protein VMM76_02430 [Pirellulaceae bacterium]|nr:hypothetical protein [Pirellulaceae bacterium]
MYPVIAILTSLVAIAASIVLFIALQRLRQMEVAIKRLAALHDDHTSASSNDQSGGLRRWLTFRMSSLLIAMTVLACLLGIITRETNLSHRQSLAIQHLQSVGVTNVRRTYEKPSGPFICNFPTPLIDDGFLPPEWVRHVMGAEFGMSVEEVVFASPYEAGRLDVRPLDCKDADLVCLQDLRNLQKLNLDHTDITDDGLRHVGQIGSLVHLSLSHTRVDGSGLRHLRGLSRLQYLELDGTNIEDEQLACLNTLPELRGLILPTQTNDETLAQIADCTNLRVLDLEGTRVTDAGLRHLLNMPHLMSLYLSDEASNLAAVKQLAGVPSLRVLRLDAYEIDIETLDALAQITQLRELDLNGYEVATDDDEILATLSTMRHLTILRLAGGITDNSTGGGFGMALSHDLTPIAPLLDLPSTELKASAPRKSTTATFSSTGGFF